MNGEGDEEYSKGVTAAESDGGERRARKETKHCALLSQDPPERSPEKKGEKKSPRV